MKDDISKPEAIIQQVALLFQGWQRVVQVISVGNYVINVILYHLLQGDLSALDDDMKTLGMQRTSNNLYLETGVRVRVSRSQYRDPITNTDLSQGELVVSGNSSEISIRYGATVQQEKTRYVLTNKGRTVLLCSFLILLSMACRENIRSIYVVQNGAQQYYIV